MIEFRDLNGAPLGTPATQQISVVGGEGLGGALFHLQFQIVETDADLPVGALQATVDWDSTQPVETVVGNRLVVYDEQRTLMPGDYFIAVQAVNFRVPQADTAGVVFPVTVKQPKAVISGVTPFLYGPILPRDSGFPSRSNYTLNRGTDLQILEASVRMLLVTTRGERIAEPEYGTDLVSLLFEMDIKDLPGLIEEEIQKAFVIWEPRVSIQSVRVRKNENRSALVDLVCVSKLDQNSFPLTLSFSSNSQ